MRRTGFAVAVVVIALVGIVLRRSVQSASSTPESLVFLPDPLRSSVVVVDAAKSRLLATLPSARPSRDVVADSTRGQLYIADTGWVTPDMDEPSTVTIWRVPLTAAGAEESSPGGAFLKEASVVARVGVGVAPIALALEESAPYLYVANAGDGTISVVDVEGAKLVSTIGVGGMPTGIAIHRESGLLYVVRHKENDVAVVSMADGQLVAEIPVGRKPSDVVVTADGSAVVVSNTDDNTVTIIDPESLSVRGTITVGLGPITLAASRTGEIIVNNMFSGSLTRVDPTELKVVSSVRTGHGMAGVVVPHAGDIFALSFKRGDVYGADKDVSRVTTVVTRTHIPQVSPEQVGL